MKRNLQFIVAASLLLTLNHILSSTTFAQGSAFTYQGQLQNNGGPASWTYNLTFTLFATNTGGAAVAGPVTNSAVSISNGLFTVIIDFGPAVWKGQTNWLQIDVETNNGSSFTILAPRQQVTPIPYAIAAQSLNGTLLASQLVSVGNGPPLGGTANFFVGPSGNATTTGGFDTAIGMNALMSVTSGVENTANGADTLSLNTSGNENTANGVDALFLNTSGFENTADGVAALEGNTSGSQNTADGVAALEFNSTGSYNIALGSYAGYNITTGSSNIDIGNQGFSTDTNIIRIGSGQTQAFIAGVIAGNGGGLTDLNAAQLTSIGNTNGGNGNFFIGPSGNATTSGSGNTASGFMALASNTGGFFNTANGYTALNANTNGTYNTASGFEALFFNTSGTANTASGVEALFNNINGSDNTANGGAALFSNTSGIQNTAYGVEALDLNASGSWNTAVGVSSLIDESSGSNDIALGWLAGANITTGSSNIDIGNLGLSTDNNIIRIGSAQTQAFIAGVIVGDGSGLTNLSAALLTSIGNNFFVGPSGNATTSGFGNTAIGVQALLNNTSGLDNTANGGSALFYNTIGSFNTANGLDALGQNISGSHNTADGYLALYLNSTGSNNIALGSGAGYNITTGSSNIDIGNIGQSTDTNTIRIGSGQTQAFIAGIINGNGGGLTNLSAAQLTSIGNANGGQGNFFTGPSGNAATSGSDNTASGVQAFFANASGSANTANGVQALFNNASGSFNTANGAAALYFNTNGAYNTAGGTEALFNNTSGSYNIALGFAAGAFITTGSSNIDIGSEGISTDTNIIRIGTSQTATYLVGTVYANGVALTSDRNAKENFTPINARTVLDKVTSLPISEWNYKTDKNAEHIGPMAQDFKAAFGLDGADDKHISVVDEGGVALAAIKGLNEKLEAQIAENTELKQQNNMLAKRLDELEAEVQALSRNNH